MEKKKLVMKMSYSLYKNVFKGIFICLMEINFWFLKKWVLFWSRFFYVVLGYLTFFCVNLDFEGILKD